MDCRSVRRVSLRDSDIGRRSIDESRGIVIFGVGSTLVVDAEESLHRSGLPVAAGIRNRQQSHLPGGVRVLTPEQLTPDLLELSFMVPMFTPGHRQVAAREAAQLGFRHPLSLIDASVSAPRRLEFGTGSYINVGCNLGSDSVFGEFVLVNRGVSIGHHVRLHPFVSVGPGVVIAAHVEIGRGSVIAVGATVLPSIKVGSNAVVGAGSVVTHDVPDGCLVFGNPARIIRREIGGYKGLTVAAPGEGGAR
jgi:acetyltransferase-like isoleucine patch superfamily enzyme